ncbi:ubiquitin carboxyl-terminal hydrolase 34-like isoform X3 [Dreissena polymorpha]|uniref:ubiquitin carboxyl-terminal hydrolase 34-like isoform X3 n=1 Tax=Dreissena polymorpha TaxID=45954 RepID=UPI0022648692|nr:ubiquitin carboxyl-terminal hydrolase 34-like isoform X3 [Dreissena polymorpha]
MCDVCSDVLDILANFEYRSQNGGFHMDKKEILSFVLYVCLWPQRQCMCCFKDYRNFEKLNSMVQDSLSVGIRLIQTLPGDSEKEILHKGEENKENTTDAVKPSEEQQVTVETAEKSEVTEEGGGGAMEVGGDEGWSMEEKDKLLQFVTKVFLMNFPSYIAYKHIVHSSLEELSQQETSALNNYCEISDPDVPLFLLRNVCFFCDTNGIGALRQCFEKASPTTLPFTFAHTLITLIANLRLWMNIPTVMQCIVPLRTAVIRYMCKLSDKDLRMAGNRNMTDLMWAAVKEPLETHFTFDKDGLDLAFKYFTCSTLTIRLAGINQLNNQITLYNESCNNETLMDAERNRFEVTYREGQQLAKWLIDNKIIEHIFGPNLHIELIKQSQIILTFLAMEGRITNEHIDCIWAAAQLKHCGKQVFELLIPLIKNLELHPVQHLLTLVSSLEIAAHTESTLYLASALIKCVWNTCAVSQSQPQALLSPHQALRRSKSAEDIDMVVDKSKGSSDSPLERGEIARKQPGTPEEVDVSGKGWELKLKWKPGQRRRVRERKSESQESDEGESVLDSEDEAAHEEEGEVGEGVVVRKSCDCSNHGDHEGEADSGESGSEDMESDDSSEGMEGIDIESLQKLHQARRKQGQHQHLHHHTRKHAAHVQHVHKHGNLEGESSSDLDPDDEEEEEEEYEYMDSDEEELLKQQKLKELMKARSQEHSEEESEYEEEEEGEEEEEEEEEGEDPTRQARYYQAHQLVLRRKKEIVMAKKSQQQRENSPSGLGNVPTVVEEVSSRRPQGDQGPRTSQDTDTSAVAAAVIAENEVRETGNKGEQTEIYDCSHIGEPSPKKRQRHTGAFQSGEMSVDDGSCHSSHLSNKSEKNMADFDGEDLQSDDELSQINAHAPFGHLSSMASMYHTHMPHVINQRPQKEPPAHSAMLPACSDFNFKDVCKSGSTLLWDLVQDDKAHLLPEGLAMDAEKVLCSLVCFCTDRRIKKKFVEACIENLANHRSVVVSLRLLPKIICSFQQYRSDTNCHPITQWAEKELDLMAHFFIDLVHYTEKYREHGTPQNALYDHKEEVQVRLAFLAALFTSTCSTDTFRLNLEQVDSLWSCLATDPKCCDDWLSWLLTQAKSKDHHALCLETFKHLFLEKMPRLSAQSMSMTGLNLFQQLSQLSRLANASSDISLPEDKISGMDQLWEIALRALNCDVSMTAIQYLNAYYIGYGTGMLEKEEEFVCRCMNNLVLATDTILQDPETSLMVIQRGLVLMKNHLDLFKRRYAFHLRTWHIHGNGIVSHQRSLLDKQSTTIRISLQPAGMGEKTQLEMSSTDLVAELRAEVTHWWEQLQKQQILANQQREASGIGSSLLTPILGAMLGDGPIRMIMLGQELTCDVDEKTLSEVQFKDGQILLVSVGASRQTRKMDGSIPSASLPVPPRDKLPMMLLNQEPYFDKLFTMLEKLSRLDLAPLNMESQERLSQQTKATVLSRKVWELLMVLPTNPDVLVGFRSITHTQETCASQIPDWKKLLDPHSPHRLMYSLQIVEGLSRVSKHRRKSMAHRGGGDSYTPSTESEMSVDEDQSPEELWSRKFIEKKGLSHMFSIFKSGSLQMKEDEAWSQWDQECLAFLLRLISQFSIDASDIEAGHDDVFETSYDSPKKKLKKQKQQDKIIIPRLDQSVISVLNVEDVLRILMKILYDAAMPVDSNHMHAGTWGRTEVVHYSLSLLVSWAFSAEQVKDCMCSSPNFDCWLKRLTLEAPEPHVRREACMGLYRLCFGRTAEGKTGYPFLLPVLASLLSFLADALKIKPQKRLDDEGSPKEKEPYGPGCRDYFWLTCRFVESISKADANVESDSPVNLNTLSRDLNQHILNREYWETRHGYEEDDALCGLFNLATAVFRHNPPYKNTDECREFLSEVFECLFALPSPIKRYLPKCKSQASRSGAYDLLVELVKGNLENYKLLHLKMLNQHTKDSHAAYPWDYWPHEDGRSKCGYVGLTNLGATCYMATCMQHLYMIPQARQSVLQAKVGQHSLQTRHEPTLMELQKMFAYLQESERKAYNPRGFCKVYTMDKLPLNTGEQKDMTEFFTDLITKLEEMGPDMKKLIKSLFGGVITNNVVSLDCEHVSRTLEEFYTVRCQVTDMKNLYESLDEVTVKDMLEGDNMYTCSKCSKKVRAEKRACFKKLPKIICFNTMRYTFNMLTMMKEKVNTHFSFPLRLEMSPYMEKNLISSDKLLQDDEDTGFVDSEMGGPDNENYDYELIGVTVHTGTADGGHYYSFIRDRLNKSESGQDKWFLFNDAEVKQFDASQIAAECFGGEMTSKTYDSVTEKFMDFSFEKTNSAYMLFYERCPPSVHEKIATTDDENSGEARKKFNFELSKELEQWIWQDNMQFLQDKNILEHTYFGFMMQVCSYIPTTLPKTDPLLVALKSSQLSTSFVLETFIHAKEKPTMVQWIELLTKQFNSCQSACEWFLDHMAESDWWPQQILIKCPNQLTRQMFQRLLIHVINRLKPAHLELYLQPFEENEDGEIDRSQLGTKSCVTRFIKKMLSILEHGVRPHSKYLMEYFAFLYDFAKMGDTECMFLIHTGSISTMVNFYMGQKAQENYVEILSDDEEEEEVIAIPDDGYKPLSLEKMIALISLLVEKSRGEDNQLQISDRDYNAIIGGAKGFPFLFSQVRDNINLRQTCNLIFSLCRWNDNLANAIVNMIFGAIKKLNQEQSQPFFKLMSLLVEFVGGPPGMPPFTQLLLQRFWELAVCNPVACLEWMANQVIRNKIANNYMLTQMETWVEHYLLKHNNSRVRNSAGGLLISLVPSNPFRQLFRTSRSVLSPQRELTMSSEAQIVLHQVFEHLLSLLPRCRHYVDPQTHGTTKLICYFTVMQYCLVSKQEKLMFSSHFNDLFSLFQPKLSEPQISMHHNKQALLLFWYQACLDCSENVKLIINNPNVCKHIPFTYILADHEDQDVMMFNRITLPAYYGLLRLCCQQSRAFTRQLGQHQNIVWAFKNITPYPGQYPGAVEELFKMMRLMVTHYHDSSEDDLKAIHAFRRSTIQLYLQNLDARSGWQTLICALKILVETESDHLIVLYTKGLQKLGEAFVTLHVMYHEATACHVTGDIVDLLAILLSVMKNARCYVEQKKAPQMSDVKTCIHSWEEKGTVIKKLVTLLNSYTPPEIRRMSIDVLKEMILHYQSECINVLIPILSQVHMTNQDANMPLPSGPYFPHRGQKPIGSKANIRPPRPHFNMLLHANQLEAAKGVDEAYDTAMQDFFSPYHSMVDLMCRVAVNQQILTEPIITFSAMVAYEGVPLHSPYFAKLWYEIYHTEVDKNFIKLLCSSNYFIDYVDAVLMDERMSLNNQNIYQFFCNFFPKVHEQVLSDQDRHLLNSVIVSITAEKATLENAKDEHEMMSIFKRIAGDLRALLLIFSVQPPRYINKVLYESLHYILQVCREFQHQRDAEAASEVAQKDLDKSLECQTSADDKDTSRRRRTTSQGSQESSEDTGETPSKRRRLSSEATNEEVANKENIEENPPEAKTSPQKEESESGAKDTTGEKECKSSENVTKSHGTGHEKRRKERSASGPPDIKDNLGSPRPVRRHESPEPGPSRQPDEPCQKKERSVSEAGIDRRRSQDGSVSSSSSNKASGDEEVQKPRQRASDRPVWVDMVAKHIESLFSFMRKSDDDDS